VWRPPAGPGRSPSAAEAAGKSRRMTVDAEAPVPSLLGACLVLYKTQPGRYIP